MRALIVGGNGAIGSAIARHADAAGIDTHVGVRATTDPARLASCPGIRRHRLDAADADAVRRVVEAVRPDWIAMAALPATGHATGGQACRELLLGMCSGLLGLLEGIRDAGFSGALVWIGSAMCYGDTSDGWYPGAAMRPRTFRGAVKASESLLAERLAAQAGIALTELRVFTGYGPYEQRDRLVASLLRAALTGDRVPLSTVPARRDWIHYDDIGGACLASVASVTPSPRVFNACSGQVHDTHEVAALLEGIVGRQLVGDVPYRHDDRYGHAQPGRLPSAAEGLDWSPRIDLANGLEQCWQWARSPQGRSYLLAGQPA